MYGTAWKKERTTELVSLALQKGFRGIDTACQPRHYEEPLVGDAIFQAVKDGKLERKDIWIQTKFTPLKGQGLNQFPYDPKASIPDQVAQGVQTSRKNLKIETIDSLLLHLPLETFNDTMLVWRAMEDAVKENYTRFLGISNMYDLK